MVFYTLKVSEIRQETADTITLCFKQPALRKVKYKAGQYLTLIFRINGRRYARPYSFSSCPTADAQMELTIKRVDKGIVSNHIHDQVKVGDIIEAMAPMGGFTCEEAGNIKEFYFWGVGSGITPLISLIKEILNGKTDAKVYLIYGNRSLESTIFSDRISILLNTYPDKFKAWHFHSRLALSEAQTYIVEGRINKNYAIKILEDTDLQFTKHYICGPAGLKESVKEALAILGVFPTQIMTEDFELIKDPKDFEEIHTQKVSLQFEGKDYSLEVTKGKTILEAALDAGVELPYSCQTGTCSTCKATCLNGQVKMIGLTQERRDLLEGECLLCCSHPITKDVYLEV